MAGASWGKLASVTRAVAPIRCKHPRIPQRILLTFGCSCKLSVCCIAGTVSTLVESISATSLHIGLRGTSLFIASSSSVRVLSLVTPSTSPTIMAGSYLGVSGNVDGACVSARLSANISCLVSGRNNDEMFACDTMNNMVKQLVTSGESELCALSFVFFAVSTRVVLTSLVDISLVEVSECPNSGRGIWRSAIHLLLLLILICDYAYVNEHLLSTCRLIADDSPSCLIADASTRYEFPIQYTDAAASVMVGQNNVRGIAGIIQSGGTIFIANIASRTVLGRTSTGMFHCDISVPRELGVTLLESRILLAARI